MTAKTLAERLRDHDTRKRMTRLDNMGVMKPGETWHLPPNPGDPDALIAEAADALDAKDAEIARLRKYVADLDARLLGRTFDSAFAKARAAGLDEFTFNGVRYHTQTAEERDALRK